jgi:hypothetical protein
VYNQIKSEQKSNRFHQVLRYIPVVGHENVTLYWNYEKLRGHDANYKRPNARSSPRELRFQHLKTEPGRSCASFPTPQFSHRSRPSIPHWHRIENLDCQMLLYLTLAAAPHSTQVSA